MYPEFLSTVGLVCGTIIAVATVSTLIWKFVKPWLREQLLTPIQEMHKQVTVNGGVSNPPTLKDELSIISKQVDQVSQDVRVLALAFSHHLVHSEDLDRRFLAMEHELRSQKAA